MKAIILAAGYATRLYPLTLDKPKPLLEVNHKSILDYIMEKLDQAIIEKVYVVTNNKFFNIFEDWQKSFGSRVEIINDLTNSNEDRLGAIGDIHFAVHKKKLENDDILVIAGDNLFEFDLTKFIDFFHKKKASCIGLIDLKDKSLIAKKYGCVLIDSSNKIIDFVEKPELPKSTFTATFIYALKTDDVKDLENCLQQNKTFDNGGEFIKYLGKKKPVYGYVFREQWFDIGSMDQLKAAESYMKAKKN